MIPPSPSPTYYTYMKAALAAVPQDAPGSGVRFARGKGYYVGAAPTPAKKPVASPQPSRDPFAAMTYPQLQAAAAAQVAAEIQAERAPIIAAQKKAAQEALAQQQAAIGFSNAAYAAANQATSGLGAAYDQAKGVLGGLNLSPEAAPYAGFAQGELGGDQAAVNSWAGQLGKIQGAQGEQDVAALIAAQQKQDADYEQQLIDLAAKVPSMRSDAMNELYKLEIAKLGARQDIQSMDLKRRAQDLYERQFGDKVTHEAITEQQGQARINQGQTRLEQGQARIDAMNAKDKAAVAKAEREGHKVNASASAHAGYLMDIYGRPILGPNGKRIKIAKTGSSGTNPQKVYGQAVKGAKSILGSPVTNPSPGLITGRGKYLAAPGAKGVFSAPDPTHPGQFIRTTNDPKKAKTDSKYTFAEALDYLLQAYPGLTRQQARKALVSAGWKPDGKRPTS